MDWNNLGKNIWSLLSAIGGISAIIVGLSAWVGSILANRLNEKFRLATEQQIKLIESQHIKEMSELQFEYDKRLEEQKQKLQYEFEIQRQALHISATQNIKFHEKQFDLYLELWNSLQDLKLAGENLWKEADIDNLMVFVEVFQKTRLLTEKISVVMDNRNYGKLHATIHSFENFFIGKSRLVELKTGNSVKVAYQRYYGDSKQLDPRQLDPIRKQIEENGFHRDGYSGLLEDIRVELQMKLEGTPLVDNLKENFKQV